MFFIGVIDLNVRISGFNAAIPDLRRVGDPSAPRSSPPRRRPVTNHLSVVESIRRKARSDRPGRSPAPASYSIRRFPAIQDRLNDAPYGLEPALLPKSDRSPRSRRSSKAVRGYLMLRLCCTARWPSWPTIAPPGVLTRVSAK